MDQKRGAEKFRSIARKVKMGKKLERVMKGDRGGTTSATSQDTTDLDNKTPEPYNCIGDFEADYLELCTRAGLTEIPQVAPRPHRPEPPPPPDPKEKVEEPTTPTPGEPEEPLPTTYTTSNKFDFFRPKVQVELEKPEDKKSMTEIYIRGWKVDQRYMDVFRLCLPAADKLHTIDLWNVGLTDNTLAQFSAVASQCLNLRTVKLDGNPVPGEGFHQLIGEDSMIVSMSLRSCKISDKGALLIGKALSTVKTRNQSLCVLNLNSNLITDVGACHLSNGLRMNRTLLILSVANNAIGDEGAKQLGEPIPKRSESRDRPMSQSSRSQLDKSVAKSGRSSSKAKKKDDKGKGKDDKKKGNKIGEAGLKALLKGIQYQITLTTLGSRSGGTGLMRLSLQKNGFPPDHELYTKIQELMVTRDPLYKPPAKSPDEDSISQTTGV
ncbi:PREDICTED: leucine-rich repeat-containing protein 71-like [Branchiostoma belcheri]|uniref:Leucine-rich repeat-containing protein 71-like n=1 Tax=Branchiostoma belcheri TaxID=7741 RepID=A0A6P4YZ01_BRABE|nr:PREDICTED: leucine-rich repeat-containing protein 71-like [Branchiostoma belcheri]